MAQEDPSRFSEWWALLRHQPSMLRRRLEIWLEAVKEEPVLIWETPAVRYTTYCVGGLLVLWIVSAATTMLVPEPPAEAKDVAQTADFHVVCVNPPCEHHFVIHRDFGFRRFPVACPKCQGETGMRARRCLSEQCKGRWVAPREDGEGIYCPVCLTEFE